jgi:DNA mismatch repair protein MutL
MDLYTGVTFNMSIILLDKVTAEKIAAGEIIENPSSVVKELVENALDAGATKVDLEIEGGGIDRIMVSDNGHGIKQTEMNLAFRRFATSKLTIISDLDQLTSLGFRGEALPSIAAVAKVEMTTRTKDDLSGKKITLSGGDITGEVEVGSPYGTTVAVRDLFFNTPGRKKFLRVPSVEASRVSSLINELALAYPHVAFSLKSNTRTLIKTNGDGILIHTIGALYGNEIANAMLELKTPVNNDIPDFKLNGYLSVSHLNRSSKRWITFIVNGRLIKNAMLVSALTRSYGDLLPSKRFPIAVLNLMLNPKTIDVNVHPAKVDIRFLDPESIKKAVFYAVKETFRANAIMPQWPDQKYSLTDKVSVDSFNLASILRENHFSCESLFDLDNKAGLEKTGKRLTPEVNNYTDPLNYTGKKNQLGLNAYKVIGQYLRSYIVVQNDDDLLLIDQHAAHERLIYNQLKSKIGDTRFRKVSQLTIPYILNIPSSWCDQLSRFLPFLAANGIIMELMGENSYVVRAVPYFINEQIKEYELYDLLERLISGDQDDPVFQYDALLKTIACHRSIKAKQPLDTTEMERLLDDWSKTEYAGYCPHGRPTVIIFNRTAVERSFLRRGK